MSRDDGIWVGIDVSKDSLDVGALPSGQVWSVPNDGAGVDRLLVEFGHCGRLWLSWKLRVATRCWQLPVSAEPAFR
jgi:hypothetical protein